MKDQKVKKTLSIIGNVFIWLFVIFAIVVTLLAFAAQSSADGVPAIGGNAILTVQTPSMEPTFNVGDIIIGKKLTTEQAADLKVDDIITYDAGDLDGDNRRDLNSHRIIEVIKSEDGKVSYRTKGDNNLLEDSVTVTSDNVICKYSGTRIKKLGTFLNFLQQPTGFLVVVVIPLAIFFIFELVMFIRKFFEIKNSGKKQITAADEELIRQRAIEEYIRSQQQNAQNAQSASESGANAGAAAADPKNAASVPETTASVPETAASVPETAASVPETAASVPETTVSVPETTVSVPETAANVPETAANVPETAASVPETAASVPETTASVPETTASVPETAASNDSVKVDAGENPGSAETTDQKTEQ